MLAENKPQLVSSTSTTTILSPKSLLLASTPLLLTALAARSELAHLLGVPAALSPSLLEGYLRTVIQLGLLGSILRPIFQARSPLLVLAYVSFMITLAAYETTSRTNYQFDGQFSFVLASLAGNITLVTAWAFGVVLRPKPNWWNPRYVIPIVGMLLGNSISAISLSLNSLTTALVENRAEIDLLLSLGATPAEATRRLVRQAIEVGTTPLLNMMRVIGIISIPGMMTGQLLGGSSALTAAKYQIFIIFMIATCVFAVVLTNAFAVVEYIGFDPKHAYLHTHRLTKNRRKSVSKALALLLGMLTSGATDLDSKPHASSAQGKNLLLEPAQPQVFSDPGQRLETRHLIQRVDACTEVGGGETEIGSCTSHDGSPVLSVDGAAKSFSTQDEHGDGTSSRSLFQNLSFQISPGDLILLKGASGTGKSTLLRGVAGLTPLDDGRLSLGKATWETNFATHAFAANWRRQIRYVVQAKVDIPGTPADLMVNMHSFQSWQYSKQHQTQFQEQIQHYLKEWGFVAPETALKQEWSQLSGGEAQRILIAISLASRPRYILFDESTSSLDKQSKIAVEASVKEFVNQGQGGVVWISHDEDQTQRLSS